MTTYADLVKRLRELAAPPYDSACFGRPMLEAADAIEALEKRVEVLESDKAYAHRVKGNIQAQRDAAMADLGRQDTREQRVTRATRQPHHPET